MPILTTFIQGSFESPNYSNQRERERERERQTDRQTDREDIQIGKEDVKQSLLANDKMQQVLIKIKFYLAFRNNTNKHSLVMAISPQKSLIFKPSASYSTFGPGMIKS